MKAIPSFDSISLMAAVAALAFMLLQVDRVSAQSDQQNIKPKTTESVKASSPLNPKILEDVRSKIHYPLDYSISDAEAANLKRVEERDKKELLTRPGLTPYLMEVLDETYRKHPQEGFNTVLTLIGERGDLSSPQLKEITNEVRSLLKIPYEKSDWRDLYLVAAFGVWEHYPSPEHESLAIEIIQREVKDPTVLYTVRVLAKIGTDKSLKPLQQVIDYYSDKNHSLPGYLDCFIKAKKDLEIRLGIRGK